MQAAGVGLGGEKLGNTAYLDTYLDTYLDAIKVD